MKKLLAGLLAAVCATCVGAAIAVFAVGMSGGKTIKYAYALLGDVYEVESGLVSAEKPDGSRISISEKSVFLDWAQGSYIFEYKSHVVNLKVYESAPEDKTEMHGAMPSGVVAGVRSVFPFFEVESGIRRTDGAPAIGYYPVSAVFSYDGQKIYSLNNIGEAFGYAPPHGGIWQLSYVYTDVFGRNCSIDYAFTVGDERVIVADFAEIYNVGDEVKLSDVYGYYRGERYSVSVTVTTPSGNDEYATGKYLLKESGSYTIKIKSVIEGEAVEKTFAINVRSGLASFVTDKIGFTDGKEFVNYSNVKGAGVSQKGVLFDMNSSEAGLAYNGVIDLKKTGRNTPLISFTTNNSYGGSISCVEVTLTDAYDAKNSVTVRFSKNSDITETSMTYDNTLVRASFGSVSAAYNNYYPLKTDAVAWDTRFCAYWLSPSNVNPEKNYESIKTLYAMNFSFDWETNEVYSYGNFSKIGWPDGNESGEKWWEIADLASPSLPFKFGGFNTGEVYLSLKVVSGKGDIVIDSIGGKSFNFSESEYEDASSLLIGSFDGSVPAVKGTEYALPDYQAEYISDVQRYVVKNGVKTQIKNGTFTPGSAGKYTFVCEGINAFGRKVSRSVEFECVDERIPISVSYDYFEKIAVGELYVVKRPGITGGHGVVSYTITVNGEEAFVGDKFEMSDKPLVITVTAIDSLNYVAEKVFEIEPDTDVLAIFADVPRTAVYGEEFDIPAARAIYYKTGERLDYVVLLDGVQVNGKVKMPVDKDKVTLEYRTEKGAKTYEITLKSADLSARSALLFAGESSTSDEGTAISVAADEAKISLPYRLSPDGLYFDFFILEDKLNFDSISLMLTDKRNVSLKLGITGLKTTAPELTVNGESVAVKVGKRRQTFSSSASAGYANKSYYAFSLLYDDWYKAILNGTAVQAYISKDLRGVGFSGFEGGVYADVFVENIDGEKAEFVITRLGNQFFYSSAFEYGDLTAPMLYSKSFRLGNANVEKGFILNMQSLSAYDVLKGKATLKINLYKPDGSVVYENASPEDTENVVLSLVGVYVLKITATDGDAISNNTYRFVVDDDSAPELIVNGNIGTTVNTGEKFVLPAASATDESGVTIKVTIFRPDGKITFIGEATDSYAGGEYTPDVNGIYRVAYTATDGYGNVSYKTFTVTAEEKK